MAPSAINMKSGILTLPATNLLLILCFLTVLNTSDAWLLAPPNLSKYVHIHQHQRPTIAQSTSLLSLRKEQARFDQDRTRNNFGDIMSPTLNDESLLFRDGLVTSETHSLHETYGIHDPLDRIAATANGNLQRIVSSYYDSPVSVVVEYCRRHVPFDGSWDRRVQLQVFGQTFCVADSVVHVHSSQCRELVQSGAVGLGQLFRRFNLLPQFELLGAGPSQQGGFWREYNLDCPGMITCRVKETFRKGMWSLRPKGEEKTPSATNDRTKNNGTES